MIWYGTNGSQWYIDNIIQVHICCIMYVVQVLERILWPLFDSCMKSTMSIYLNLSRFISYNYQCENFISLHLELCGYTQRGRKSWNYERQYGVAFRAWKIF